MVKSPNELQLHLKSMQIIKPFFLLFPLLSILSLSGCASLPNVSEKIEGAPVGRESPQILSAKGVLSPKQSKALMERLQRSVNPTDILQRYMALIESVSESPLTKGNKVTLLVDGPATYAAMFKAIRKATDHINLETFIMEDMSFCMPRLWLLTASGRPSALPIWISGVFQPMTK